MISTLFHYKAARCFLCLDVWPDIVSASIQAQSRLITTALKVSYEFRWTNRTDGRRSGVLVFGTSISSSVKVPNGRDGGGGGRAFCFDSDDIDDDHGATTAPMTVHGRG
jgi:hypothetical protein